MRPHQIQRDLPVDLARGTARGHMKIVWIYFAHEPFFVSYYDK